MSDPKQGEDKYYELDADSRAEASAEGNPESPRAVPEPELPPAPETAALTDQIAKLQAEKEELRQTLIRRQADFENTRKRLERERLEQGQRAVARMVEGLLPTLDAFERALAAHDDPVYEDYRKGFELIYRQLWDTLSRYGLERIDDVKGKPFDPHVHQAVERVETEELPDGSVLEVLQHGYKIGSKLLRPASVRVAVHPSGETAQARKQPN